MTQSAEARQEPFGSQALAVGSTEHKAQFCAVLLDTFDPYKPATIPWPELSPDARMRLVSLPFWDVAVATEENAGTRIQALADITADPLIRKALELNAFEERRHKAVLGHMVRFYGIALQGDYRATPPRHPHWTFLRTGYGECFDSFFAFGLFEMARRTEFFPRALVDVFEPVIQEEARHNLFFVNWRAYTRANLAWPRRWWFDLQCAAAIAVQVINRLGTAKAGDAENFTRKGGESLGFKLDAGDFFRLCLTENDRRLRGYDPRLLRPRLMPLLARVVIRLMPGAAPG